MVETAMSVKAFFSLASSLAAWIFLPKWLARSQSGESHKDVDAMREPALRAAEEIERLTATKAALDKAIADYARERDELSQRFHFALKDTGVSMSQQDRDLRYIWIHNAPHGLKKTEFVGQLQADVMPAEIEPRIAQAKRKAMAERTPVRLEVHAMVDGEPRWFDERISPVIRDGEIIGVMTTSIDTTAYRAQEDYLRELLRELTHRTKNLLAVILGIARRSGHTSPDIETFVAQFSGRIRALSITHELLVNASWSGVDLKSLLEAIWHATSPLTSTDVCFSGNEFRLAPESAQNLALAFHEMAARSTVGDDQGLDGAQVHIDWRPYSGQDDRGLMLVWEENARHSDRVMDEFARSYLEVLLPRATGGSSELAITEAGLRWTVKLPSRNFAA
jgi:two-component sensor histidine kinase